MKLLSITDIGVSRKENQDNFWSARLMVDGLEAGAVCLCDGMGGLDNGGLASRLVVEAVRDYFMSSIDFDGLNTVLQGVNKTINSLAIGRDKSMGTTCTVLLCYNGTYKVLHVGDSRCYRVHEGRLEKLTTDHSALAKYGITHKSDPQAYNKFKNLLTRCLGVKPDVIIDYGEGSYADGDSFFLCSDGMWHYLDDYEFSEISELYNLDGMVRKCIDSGETDNITACILKV